MSSRYPAEHWVENTIKYLTTLWGIDTKSLAPSLQRDYKEFNKGRIAIIAALIIFLTYLKFVTGILAIVLLIWGYKTCTDLYPQIHDDLKFHQTTSRD